MKKTTIGEKIDDFITYKRSLGYAYDTPERYLKHYQHYVEEQYPHLNLPDKESTDGFLDKYKGQTGGLYNAMAPLREFSRYLFQLRYMGVYLVPPKQMPKLHPEAPYFFSEDELFYFFRECDSYYAENPEPRARYYNACSVPGAVLLWLASKRSTDVTIQKCKPCRKIYRYLTVKRSKKPPDIY